MVTPRLLLALVLALPAAAAPAGTVYKCVAPGGAVSYQDAPCPRSQSQRAIALPDARAPLAPPAAAAGTPAPPTPAPAPPPARPVAPLPTLFQCVRTTDGETYLSSNGQPAPYQAPFGMLGAVSMPLTSAYGHGGGASAPELNRGNVTAGLVANHYVWVQDSCRALGPQETCEALRDEYDRNERKLRQAFKSEQGPFLKREAELESQLRGC